MKITKIIAAAVILAAGTGSLYAQQDVTVEDEYLSSVEDVIVNELASAPDRDNKFVALQYIEAAIEKGSISPDMQQALDMLAGEGTTSQSRERGRLMNNFPDVRARACALLGRIATEESKNTLVKIALSDNEPMVLTAAIRSLGEIGINDGDQAITTIEWAQKRNAVLNPTSSMAMEVLTAYEKLLPSTQNKKPIIESIAAIQANSRYIKPVRDYAAELLQKVSGQQQ